MKRKYFYYDPELQKGDCGYMVDIYYYDGKKSKLIRTHEDKDYKKILEKARVLIQTQIEKWRKLPANVR